MYLFPFSIYFTAVQKVDHSKWRVQELLKEIINRQYELAINYDQAKSSTKKWEQYSDSKQCEKCSGFS